MFIDAIGKPCPLPVIEAKKAIRSMGTTGGEVIIRVDNEEAVENIKKMCAGDGHLVTVSLVESNFDLTIIIGEAKKEQPMISVMENPSTHGLIVAIGSDCLGNGDDTLGRTLMKSFVYSLRELDTLPECILFFNGGVHLTKKEATTLEDLKALEDAGVAINSCGACLDFYGIKENLGVGSITNMYAIVTTMAEAGKLIRV